MIIRALRAEGFMRYQLLELKELNRGVVALVGDNESGKSTIGEAIAFSIFGRTVRTEDTDPTQAINWEVDACRTSIEIEIPGKGVHRIERVVARTGELEARLFGPGGVDLADGPQAVTTALEELLGFDFTAFRFSFYVAQGELDLIQLEGRDNARRVVYDMLGISTIDRARARLESARDEHKEHAGTLERDLLVAQALHTEALPLRDEVAGYDAALQRARELEADAQASEAKIQGERDLYDRGLSAHRRRGGALTGLEGSLVADTHRRTLQQACVRLTARVEHAAAHVKKAEAALTMDEAPIKQARASLTRAEAVDREARRLHALVEHRRDQLAGETSESAGVDGLPGRLAREEAASTREGKTVTWAGILLGLFLVLGLLPTGAGAGLYLPQDKPLWTLPISELHSPKLGLQIKPVTRKKTAAALGSLGGLFFLLSVWAGLTRLRARRRRDAAKAEHARLTGVLSAKQAEHAACRDFSLGSLDGIAGALSGVSDPQVTGALGQLQEAGGDLLSRAESPEQLVAAARKRHDDLQDTRREAEPRLAEANRVAVVAQEALTEVESSIEVAFPNGAPELVEPDDELPEDLKVLAREVEQIAAEAARARVGLEALLGGGQGVPIAEPVRELRDSITIGLEASGDAQLREKYDKQTGLAELLKTRETPPSVDDLRLVIRRERELLEDLFGEEEEQREALTSSEERLKEARLARAKAKAELDEVLARGERVQLGRKRLEDLETRIARLESAFQPTKRKIEVHDEAILLMGDLAQAMKTRFGPGIARYIELVLPRLTQGRYRRVRIDDDLDIRVYSSERGDFVRLIELSLGTADQVLVALRLGLSRALIASRGICGGHFLFLDEPMVSADAGREQAFFDLLRAFDDEFAQIFVTSPRALPKDGPFTLLTELTRDVNVVRLSAAPAGANV